MERFRRSIRFEDRRSYLSSAILFLAFSAARACDLSESHSVSVFMEASLLILSNSLCVMTILGVGA
jgi:hypothetical protein